MHPIALELSLAGHPILISSYGALLALAVLVGGTIALRAAIGAGIDTGRALAAIAFAVLGAFGGGAVFQWLVAIVGSETLALATLGARAVIGSLVGGLVALVAAHFVLRVPFPRFSDAAIVSVPIAQSIGRIGCFLGGCCYGAPTHFALAVASTDPRSPPELRALRHPWPLYESAADLAIAAILALALRHTRPGIRTAAFFGLYSSARIVLEFLRGDDADRGMFFHDSVSASQLACGVILVAALAALAWLSRYIPKQRSAV